MKLIDSFLAVFSLIFVPLFFYESVKLFFLDTELIYGVNISFYMLGASMLIASFYYIYNLMKYLKNFIQCLLSR